MIVFRLLLILAGLYIAIAGTLFLLQRRMIFVPDTARPDPMLCGVPEVVVVPLMSGDGTPLYAWTIPAPADGMTVLYLHGNAGSVGGRSVRIRRFMSLGWGVYMPEYRGYGGNSGDPTEAGLMFDARAALAALRARGVPAARTVIWGESLGTGLAVQLAAETRVAAVILESPYTSMVDLARGRYWFLPVAWLVRDPFDSLSRIALVTAPILIIQGGLDAIVPPAMGRALLAAANAPKELLFVAEAGHNDLMQFGAMEAVAAFVRKHAGQ